MHLLSIILVFVMIYWILRKTIAYLRAEALLKARLLNLEKSFQDLKVKFNRDSEYLRFSIFILLKGELADIKKQVQDLRSIFLRKKIQRLQREIRTFENDLVEIREHVNERFFQQEKLNTKYIFCNEKGTDLLTDEQLRAVLCNDNRNLIIAGAGSGKTRVIDFKVRYLVNHKNVSPDKILLLSFSKKSASDLVEKISRSIPDIEAQTIHAFGRRTIGKIDKNIFDENSKELESIVIKALAQTFKEKNVFRRFEEFYQRFFSELQPMIHYENLADLRRDLKKINSKLMDTTPDDFGEIIAARGVKTLRGEYVRSVDERYIADFLYLNEIKYDYEPRYPRSEKKYNPDFYLPDYDIYLEHFAITKSGRPPPYFDNPKDYMDGIQWKRDVHKHQKTRMIESYTYLLNGRDTSTYLADLLTKNGIKVYPDLERDEIYSKMSQVFLRIFTHFYRSFKLSGFSLQDLRQKYIDKRYLLFLQTFENFLVHFEAMALQENRMDFNDMLIGAIAKYKEGNIREFDYIIVDEFQDTSNLAMKLLDEVYQSNPHATLLSVGDDWQSIYGFSGSDVTILSDYANRYSGVSVQNLNNNFRSHSRLVDLGRQFISKNPAQIQKNVVSNNRNFKESEIGFLSFEQMEAKIMTIPDYESVLVLYRYNDDCPAARGMFRDFFVLDNHRKPVRRASCTKNISMMTIHASKGLEAQHVFMLFPDGVKRKFPSEIENHFVFNMLKTNFDDYPFSEERRLMYVAITRAEQNLYFVSSKDDPNSVFWDELNELVKSSFAH